MKALVLAKLYLLGSLRRQAHLATLFLGFVLFLLPAYVNAFSLGADTLEKVAKDFGLILIGYFLVAMALFLGSTAVPGDVEARSIYPILARPISRGTYLLAHLLATLSLLVGSAIFLSLCLSLSIGLMIRELDAMVLLAVYGSFLQAAILAAISLGLSIRLAPAAAGTLGALVFLAGHLSGDFARLLLGGAGPLAKAALPDLSLLALKEPALHGLVIGPSYLGGITIYTALWSAIALLAARTAFEEVDL